MKTHGIAIIGTGNNARAHVLTVLKNGKARLAALVTDDPEQGQALAASNGVECPIYTDLDQMLSDPEVEIVIVCTPNNLHARQAALAARAGKHLLIEKPVALNLAELRQMHEAVKTAGVKTQVAFCLYAGTPF